MFQVVTTQVPVSQYLQETQFWDTNLFELVHKAKLPDGKSFLERKKIHMCMKRKFSDCLKNRNTVEPNYETTLQSFPNISTTGQNIKKLKNTVCLILTGEDELAINVNKK